MEIVVATFVTLFLLIASGGLLLFYRSAMLRRLSSVTRPEQEQENQSALRQFVTSPSAASIGSMVEPFQKILPRSSEESSVVQKRLVRAGYRKDSHSRVFYGSKFLVPVALIGLVTVTGAYEIGAFFAYAVAAGLGFLVPDFWLGNRISARQRKVRRGLPDVLDLMVICIEAGLSIDQAVNRAVDELGEAHPEICDELGLVILEQRAGKARSDAWKHLSERTDLEPVRALVTIVVQADQFGTSVSKGLRSHSETLRVQRRQNAEEQAAKTTVKMVFPLVLFIFPSLFVVVLGPSMIVMLESFEKYLSGV